MSSYISPQGVAALANYKYSGVDHSILVKLFLAKFWNWLIEYVPKDIAPNLITLVGIMSVFIGYFTCWHYLPAFEGAAPTSAYFFVAFCIFSYQTLDNLDGKQARRTGSSSPLGECFDHGGDSLTVIAFAGILGSVLQLGPVLTFVCMLLLMLVFYLFHWEAYFTGSLVLRPLDNPTEAQWTMITLILFTGVAGPLVWFVEFNIPFVGPVQLNHLVFFAYVMGSVNTCIDNFTRVFEHCNAHQINKAGPMLCLVPVSFIVLASLLCTMMSPAILSEAPRAFMAATGFMFSYVQIRLILQCVCKEPFKVIYNVQLPLVVLFFNCFMDYVGSPIFSSSFAVIIYTLVNLGTVSYLIVSVVNELATILNIRVFVIVPPATVAPRV